MIIKRLVLVVAAVAIMAVAAGNGKVMAGDPQPLGRCGGGFDLVYWPFGEEIILDTNGHVNGDGFVCVNDAPNSKGDTGFVIIVDNVVPFKR